MVLQTNLANASFNSTDASEIDRDPYEAQSEVFARLRRIEKQHASDKAAWKLKMESALANARQVSGEKDKIMHQYEKLKEQHDKTLKAHLQEKKRLETNSQESEREFKKSMAQAQRELKLKISELTAEITNLQASAREQNIFHQGEIADLTTGFRAEKEEMKQKISTQHIQIELLKDGNQKALELCEQLSIEQKRYSTEQHKSQTTHQSNSLEIAFLRDEIESLRAKEKEYITTSQADIESLKEKLDASTKREEAVVLSLVELQNKLRDHAKLIESQDEELDAWASTAQKLEECLTGVVELESRSTESLPEHVACMVVSLKRYIGDSSNMSSSCVQLRDEVAAWKCQFEELEKTHAELKKVSGKDKKLIQRLEAKTKEQESSLQTKEQEVVEWEANYSKIEQCVEDLMKLENETSQGFQDRINSLTIENTKLKTTVETLDRKCRDLLSENAGLRVVDDLGLEAAFSAHLPPKRANTPTTEDDDSLATSPNNK